MTTKTEAVLASPVAPALGAIVSDRGVTFRLWSTTASDVAVVVTSAGGRRERRPLNDVGDGVFEATFADVRPGDRYHFELDGVTRPDPYARWLPDGPDGVAEVWQSTFVFRHAAPSLRADQLVIYELHVGTFTPQGTYSAATEKLDHLRDLGVNCVELMPLAAAAGRRGWGYDGVAWFAPFAPYGPPEALQEFVDAAHGHGIAVLLDAVYNHFGPAGNYLAAYSPEYFTPKHKTPWGDAMDYGNPYMRRLAVDSAEHWLRTFRFDGFRLDATHEIHDDGERHFLEELTARVHALRQETGTRHFLFCEDDRNWPGLVTRFGMDGLWADDFHHQTRVLLTGERDGYFAAYEPTAEALAKCINRGWTYEGQTWTVGTPRQRGNPADDLAAPNFVYAIQNHDQIGNRAHGDRLHDKAGPDGFLAASTLLLFLPMTPLIFQGQEWMSDTPFQYFTDHTGELGEAITRGRTAEFSHFESFKQSHTPVPDPQAQSTFERSKLNWDQREEPDHAAVLQTYRHLLKLRQTDPVLTNSSRHDLHASAFGSLLIVERRAGERRRVLLVNFSTEAVDLVGVPGLHLAEARVILGTKAFPDARLAGKGALLLAFDTDAGRAGVGET